jgi:hypothetical protein
MRIEKGGTALRAASNEETRGQISDRWSFLIELPSLARACMALFQLMSVREIIAELPKLSDEEREMILQKLVNLDEHFEPTPAMSDAIREGLHALTEKKTYSTAELRERIAAWTAR